MPKLAQPNDSAPEPVPGPVVTPLFTQLLEAEAARRGLPPEPWAA
jgi:hypothetical protein